MTEPAHDAVCERCNAVLWRADGELPDKPLLLEQQPGKADRVCCPHCGHVLAKVMPRPALDWLGDRKHSDAMRKLLGRAEPAEREPAPVIPLHPRGLGIPER